MLMYVSYFETVKYVEIQTYKIKNECEILQQEKILLFKK